jgi:hypothetical protein
VTPGTAETLNQSGADGQALADAIGATPGTGSGSGKPSGGGSFPSAGGPQRAAPGIPLPAAPGDNPLDAVFRAAGEGATTGAAFTGVLLVLTLLMGTWAWLAYRRRST